MHLHIQIVDFFILKGGGGSTNLSAPMCKVPNFIVIPMSFCFFKSLRVMFTFPVKQWFQWEMCIKSEIKKRTVKCKRPRGFSTAVIMVNNWFRKAGSCREHMSSEVGWSEFVLIGSLLTSVNTCLCDRTVLGQWTQKIH